MSDKKEKKQVLNVEITATGANGKDGAHKVGEKLEFNGELPRYLVGKCRVLANGKA